MYRVVAFEKILVVEAKKPYGSIRIFFENPKSVKALNRLSITKFMALSHILENDRAGYDPEGKVFKTNVEQADFVQAPNGEL